MKMKKLVSAIAALAIAGSAFTGMTIVNAEATEVDFIGSSTAAETFDNCDGTGWSSTAAGFSTAASGNSHFGIVAIAEIAKPEVGATASGTPTYVSGSALSTQVRGKTAATTTYTMSEAVRNGQVYFAADMLSSSTYINPGTALSFYDSTGSKLCSVTLDYANTSNINLLNGTGTEIAQTSSQTNFRGVTAGIGYNVGLVLDIDNQTVKMTADYTNTEGVRTQYESEAISCEILNVASFDLTYTGPASSNNFAVVMDNIKLYAMTEKVTVTETTVTINKVDTEGNDLGSETVTGVVAGDPYEATDAQKSVAAVEADGVKYVYTYVAESSTDSIESLSAAAADNVLTLVFSKAAKNPVSSVTVNYNADGTTVLSEPKTVTGYEDDVVGIGFKKYILVDGTVYESTKGASAHYVADTKLAEGAVADITVTAKTVAGTPVALVEGSGSNGDNAAIRASEGEATRGLVSLGTVEPGVYSIEAGSYRRGGDTWLYLDGVQLMALNVYANAWGVAETTDITITTVGELTAGPGESSSDYIDYLLLTKTGDVTVDPTEPPVETTPEPTEPPVETTPEPTEPPVEATPDPDSPYASGNLITNGDFTNGTTDWTNAADGGEYAGTISDNAEYIHGDGKALTNTASAGGSAASTLRRFVPVEAGKKYYLSFYVYNATGAEISGFGPMSAFVPVVGNVFGSFNGLTFKDYVEYGGQNSWSAEPQSEVNQARVDLSYAPGMNHKEFTITVPEGAENLMLSMFAWTDAGTLYFSDFELYELKPEKTLPEVAVAEFGTYTSDSGNPAKAYTGTFTVDAEQNVAVGGVTWTVGTASATSTFDTVISSGTVVTGLVVTAADLTAIPAPAAAAVAAE